MRTSLEGSLRLLPPDELLALFRRTAPAGRLRLSSAGTTVTLWIAQGGVIAAGEAGENADAREAALTVLAWRDGELRFDAMEIPAAIEPGPPLVLEELLAERQRREETASALYADPGSIFRPVGEPDLEKVTLTATELRVLMRIDGRRPLGGVAREAKLSPDETGAIVRRLAELRLVEPGEESELPAAGEPGGASADATLRSAPAGGFSAACLTLHDDARTSFPLFDAEYTIGRDPANAIRIEDGSVSSRHALLRRTHDGYRIEDQRSRNGTWVNGERVESRLLANDDVLRLGKVEMIYTTAALMQPSHPTAPGRRSS